MSIKYKITDSDFNRANYPDLIGQIVDNPPAYAKVELVKDLPSMESIWKNQSNWIGESYGETKLDDFIIKCLKVGYDKPEIIEGLRKYFSQSADAAEGIFTRAVVKIKNIKPPKEASRMNWYKKAKKEDLKNSSMGN